MEKGNRHVAASDQRGVLFDVDGTLIDTTYLHTVCWAEALRQGGHDVPMARVHRAIGMGSDEILDHLLGQARDRSTDQQLRAAHLGLYAQHWERLRPLPGARDLVRACAEGGRRVVLASSASADELAALRSALDADDAIDEATSSSDVSSGKPAPDVLQAGLDASGLDLSRVVFVGDAVWDGRAAAKLGIPFIGLTCGGTGAAELIESGAAEVYADPAALLASLGKSLLH